MERSPQHSSPLQNDRRTFLETCASFLAGITIVGVAAPLLEGCEPSVIVSNTNTPQDTTGGGGNGNGTVFDVSTLTSDGQGLMTTVKGPDNMPVLIVRISATNYVALSSKCTHEGCQVNQPRNSRIACPCHNSQYDLSGNVLQGPASQPLKKYESTFDAATKKLTVKIQ